MIHIQGFRCSICGMGYAPDSHLYVCPSDGGNLDTLLDIDYLREHLQLEDILSSRDHSVWRYAPLLPVEHLPDTHGILDTVGDTPMYAVHELGHRYGVDYLWVKDEGRNPTCSLKDRGSVLVVSQAKAMDEPIIVAASTGNAGAALAGLAAAVQQRVMILAPKTAPRAKVAQLMAYGAEVVLVDGSYDDAFDLSIQMTETYGWYNRNTGFNPLTIEGKKTAAYEIWESLRLYQPEERPLKVFVSVGDGNIIAGLHKGFQDLYDLGWLERMPQLYGIQSDKSSAIADAFLAGTDEITRVNATSRADSISVNQPRDGYRALRAVRQTGGQYIKVSDEAILAAIPMLGKEAIFAEPAGAAALAGLIEACDQGLIEHDDQVVVLNTGNGLKDVPAVIEAMPVSPDVIGTELCDLTALVEEKGLLLP